MKVLVSLGGNAILKHGQKGTAEEQEMNVHNTAKHLAAILRRGERIAITHGNGPQVGNILLQNEIAKQTLPPMPLDVCGAESQGMIGYMLQRALRSELESAGQHIPVTTIVSQTLVDPKDPAFKNPTKPVGPFYTEKEAQRLQESKGWHIIKILGVETLLILTDVEKVFINYGKPDQRAVDSMTVQECKKYLAEGQFPAGSMGPKIESAVSFLSGSSGRRVVIASLEKAEEALKGIAGTTITNQ